MASQPYPGGTFPVQFVGGGIARSKFNPLNTGGPYNQFTGGVVFAGGVLQNNKLFDATFGSLTYPYLGQRNKYNDNKPINGFNIPDLGGIQKALPNGAFATMTAGQYVMLTFNTQLAGVPTIVMRIPGSSFRKSQNLASAWVNTVQINRTGGWYYNNGLPINPLNARDNIKSETFPGSYAIPGRLVFMSTGKNVSPQSYPAKNN